MINAENGWMRNDYSMWFRTNLKRKIPYVFLSVWGLDFNLHVCLHMCGGFGDDESNKGTMRREKIS